MSSRTTTKSREGSNAKYLKVAPALDFSIFAMLRCRNDGRATIYMMFSSELTAKQSLITEFFSKSLEKSHLARAYLLVGLAARDKHQLIKELNQILNCKKNHGLEMTKASKPKPEDSLFGTLGIDEAASLVPKFSYQPACGQCQNCLWIASDEHPKTPIVLAGDEGAKKNIKVERIREMQQEMAQKSEFTRIVVIEDASSVVLNKASATALLKTIEEARANTIFILLAESKDTVLPTIVSRAQVLNFINNEELEFSEAAQVLIEELRESINSGVLSSRLEQLVLAESLGAKENQELTEMLCLMQNEAGEMISAGYEKQADLILEIERAISDLKSFVRPKAVLSRLLAQL